MKCDSFTAKFCNHRFNQSCLSCFWSLLEPGKEALGIWCQRTYNFFVIHRPLARNFRQKRDFLKSKTRASCLKIKMSQKIERKLKKTLKYHEFPPWWKVYVDKWCPTTQCTLNVQTWTQLDHCKKIVHHVQIELIDQFGDLYTDETNKCPTFFRIETLNFWNLWAKFRFA